MTAAFPHEKMLPFPLCFKKCYLSKHVKVFPRLSPTDTSGGMIIEVDAPLKEVIMIGYGLMKVGGGSCFFYSSYSHRKQTNNTSST